MIERVFVEQGVKMVELERLLKEELKRAGFTKAEIIKTPLVTRISVNVIKPSLAIGKSGQNIKQLTEIIGKKFKIENPQIEIREIENPNLDARAVANRLKALIERGFSWRSVVYRTVKDIQAQGAQGVEFLVSGKLAGKGGRKKKVRISAGYMKKVGHQTRFVDSAKEAAYTKAGAIGLKVKIVKPDMVFPDKFNLKEYITELKKKPEKPALEAQPEKQAPSAAEENKEEVGTGEKAKNMEEEPKRIAADKPEKTQKQGKKTVKEKPGKSAKEEVKEDDKKA